MTQVVDVFDSRSGQWHAAKLSQRRSNLAATGVGGRFAVFGGGSSDEPNPGAAAQVHGGRPLIGACDATSFLRRSLQAVKPLS